MSKICDIPQNEKPREKALRYGLRCLSSAELLAIILRSGPKGSNVLDTANELLKSSNGFAGLGRLSIYELCQIRGISKVKALEIMACFEISRRAFSEKVPESDAIQRPAALVRWLQSEIGLEMQEKFMAVYLDSHNRILSWNVLFTGTINESRVYPREIFREAIVSGAVNVILVHNHPSGDPVPSMQDIALTDKLVQAGKLMGVRVIDHLIVTRTGWLSMAGESLLGGMEELNEN